VTKVDWLELVIMGVRLGPFAASPGSAVQVRVPPNNGLQCDAPQAARA